MCVQRTRTIKTPSLSSLAIKRIGLKLMVVRLFLHYCLFLISSDSFSSLPRRFRFPFRILSFSCPLILPSSSSFSSFPSSSPSLLFIFFSFLFLLPGGRYLYSSPLSADDTVVLDFNQSYSPWCNFTDFATCVYASPANKLPLRITAGEMAQKTTRKID